MQDLLRAFTLEVLTRMNAFPCAASDASSAEFCKLSFDSSDHHFLSLLPRSSLLCPPSARLIIRPRWLPIRQRRSSPPSNRITSSAAHTTRPSPPPSNREAEVPRLWRPMSPPENEAAVRNAFRGASCWKERFAETYNLVIFIPCPRLSSIFYATRLILCERVESSSFMK